MTLLKKIGKRKDGFKKLARIMLGRQGKSSQKSYAIQPLSHHYTNNNNNNKNMSCKCLLLLVSSSRVNFTGGVNLEASALGHKLAT